MDGTQLYSTPDRDEKQDEKTTAALSAMLEMADAEEQLHSELAALHARHAELVRMRRARLEHYALAEAGR